MNLNVLLMSDDSAMIEMLQPLLGGRRFDMTTVASTEQALQQIAAHSPHIVIVDLSGPQTDGRSACRAIRLASNVPILVLSALKEPALVARMLDAGADDYLVKPVPATVLVAHLRKLARRTGALRATQPEPADWMQDTQPVRL